MNVDYAIQPQPMAAGTEGQEGQGQRGQLFARRATNVKAFQLTPDRKLLLEDMYGNATSVDNVLFVDCLETEPSKQPLLIEKLNPEQERTFQTRMSSQGQHWQRNQQQGNGSNQGQGQGTGQGQGQTQRQGAGV